MSNNKNRPAMPNRGLHDGLTKLEYFAAHALAGSIAGQVHNTPNEQARTAYEAALCLLEILEKDI